MRTVYGARQRFLDTYFSKFPGMFVTGDGARRDADGYYWITGRVDDVINVSGHRLGTAEVDFGLTKPNVLDVTFAYLGGGLTEVTHSADDRWVAEARDSLNALTARISTSDFEESPGSWCNSCDFLQFCGPGQAEVEG